MKKYIYTFFIIIGLSGLTYADDIQGTFICKYKNSMDDDDETGTEIVYKIRGEVLNSRRLDGEKSYEHFQKFSSKEVKHYINFKVFVGDENTGLDVIVLTASDNPNKLYFNKTTTSWGSNPKGRAWYGFCSRI